MKLIKNILITFLIFTIYLNANTVKQNEPTQLDITLSLISSMSNTVHSLQQERGASCGYVSSSGMKFKDKLRLIRINSDKRIDKLHNLLESNEAVLEKYLSHSQHQLLDSTFNSIIQARIDVTNLKLNFSKTYSKYTQSIAFMLLQISEISDLLDNKELNDALYAYSTLLMHKESIGQKRAELSALFSNKEFAKEIFEYYLTSDTQEKIYLKSFLHSVNSKVKHLYKNTLDYKTIKIVKKYEKLAKDKLSGKDIAADPQEWFANVTEKINLIQKVEYKLFEDILMIVHRINTNALITLTKKEQNWIENNPIVKIAVMTYWKHDSNGNSIHTDVLKLLNKYGNLNIVPAKYNAWKDGYTDVTNGENIHGIMNLSWSKQREEKYFNYTKAYNYAPNYLIVRKDNTDITSLKDLKNKIIYLKEKAITQKIIDGVSKDIKVINLKTDDEMYKALSLNKNVDAFLSYTINEAELEKYNLKVAKTLYDKTGEVAIGINKKYSNLSNIINKIYKVMPKELLEELRNKEYIDNTEAKNNLTTKEKQWIETHIVKVGVEQWLPVVFSNDGKDIDGIAGDFLMKIIEKTGLKIEVVNESWDKLLKDFKNKKLDLLPATYYTDNRAKFGLYSDGYFKMKDSIYIKEANTHITSLKDLNGKTLAIPKGYGTIDKLKQEFPQITLVLTKDLDDSINRVLNGRVSAFYEGNIAAQAKIKSELIEGLKAVPVKEFNAPAIHFFSKIDEPILQSILQKTIKSFTYQERNKIISKWTMDNNNLRLTNKEKEWIDKEEVITYVYDSDWAPFEWTNALEEHTGIISDILGLISHSSGLKFKAIVTPKWSDAVEKMKNQKANMYSAVVENEKRRQYVKFTSKNIYSSPGVIVTRVDDNTIYVDIKSALENKTVGVVKSNAIYDYLLKTYPNLKFKTLNSTEDGFERLQSEDIDVFILNAATAQYFMQQKGYNNTRIATKIDFDFNLKIAIQKNMPQEVLSILDKAINNISPKELNDIYHKWTQGKVENKTDWVLIGEISGVIFLILLFILWNNYKLKSTVEEKTKDLKDVLDSMELTIKERTQELNDEKNFINTIMDSQESFVITSDGKCLKTVNKAFRDFYNVKDTDEFMIKHGACICDTFDTTAPKEYIQKMMGDEKWLTYINNRPNEIHKTRIIKDDKEYIFTIASEKLIINGKELKTAIFTDITQMESAIHEIESIHKHTRDAIEYASLIQGALLPDNKLLINYFKDNFVTWTPKDTVGGDIWLFDELRHEDECLIFYIDCTGHGVPGAFVTMIVKAVEREVISKIKADRYNDIDVSPAWIMGYFNRTMKVLLKQETKDSISNAGWDGGIVYYNRRTQIIKFAGAETPLFYMTKDGEFNTVKGNRYSVGYKKCAMDYEYKESIINVEEGMKFYCTTDGYLDQNGGEKDFPFGKKRFGSIIKENYKESMADQQAIFQLEMDSYERMIPNNDRNDDMTVIGFEIGAKSNFIEQIIEEIIKYEGVMTQNVIATCMDNIEVKIDNLGMVGTVSTITIEYCQNMMNYSKNDDIGSRQIVPAGSIEVQNLNNEYYEIMATNIVSFEDKEKIEPKLIEIQGLDKAGIKKRYRELRKSGQNTHEKGGGIGMYEIAKVSDSIEYKFNKINDDKYSFTMKSIVKPKVRKEKEE